VKTLDRHVGLDDGGMLRHCPLEDVVVELRYHFLVPVSSVASLELYAFFGLFFIYFVRGSLHHYVSI
jgi:hypothetical protein